MSRPRAMNVFGDLVCTVWETEAMLKQTLGVAALKHIGKIQVFLQLWDRLSNLNNLIYRAKLLEGLPEALYKSLAELNRTLIDIFLFVRKRTKGSRLRRMLYTALIAPHDIQRFSRELEEGARKVVVTLYTAADDRCFICGLSGSDRRPSATEHLTEQHRHAESDGDNFVFPFVFNGRLVQINAPTMDAFAHGASGRIIRAFIETNHTTENVALKVLHHASTPDERELLTRELNIWGKLNHARILPYYGTCHVGLGQPALVSPYMEHGNLSQYLKWNKGADRLTLIQQVAEGLEYLHEIVRIVHGDLKCENVLINKDGSALLSDFGLSTFVDAGPTATATEIRMRNTVRFAAPELLLDAANDEGSPQSRSKTTASDVYAFGMLVYQVYTGVPPWPHVVDMALYMKIICSELPQRPDDVSLFSDTLWEICKRCWSLEPHARPLIRRVCESLYRENERPLMSPTPPYTPRVTGGGQPPLQDEAVR